MAPTKESDTLSTVIEKPLAAGDSGRAQPVALEVPVTVNGARAIEGSDRREPFSETTQTVLVFGHGAVIRLASAVVSGQLLFLTNEKSKKEVVCQVVKSKNYRNVTGYVELEFTEAIPGFWGMRFPNERVSSVPASQVTPVSPVAASGSPASPKAAPVVPSPASSASEAKTSAPVLDSHEILTTDALKTAKLPASLTLPHTLEVTSAQHQPKISVPNEPSWTSSIPHAPETKAPVPSAIKSDPLRVASTSPAQSNNTESKLPLTERLSVLEQKLKTPLAAGLATPVAKKPATELASKVVQIAKADVPSLKAVPKKTAPVASSLDVEEVKIPTWLEPLARNSTAHNVQEVTGKEETPEVAEIEVIQYGTEHRHTEVHHTEVHHTEVSLSSASSASPTQDITGASTPKPLNFPVQAETSPAESKTSSGKHGTVIGAIAAGILLLIVGGAWYARRPSAQSTTPVASVAAGATQPSAAQAASPTSNAANVLQGSDATPQGNIPTGTATAQTVRSVDKSYAAQELAAYKKLAEPEPKKSTIGEVHLATPTLSRSAVHADNTLDSAPSLADTPARNVSAGSLIAGNNMQPAVPAAPLPVGGDVKTARLLSTVPPVYPSLARSQRISGDVRVEALIDASGKVSTMKVISGPTLLHQAAMDSLRQWKYQPATLNGTPVAMRLTATVQFHLQ
jgi:TonB family protein